MKETLTLTWKLLLICVVVTALLAGVNTITKPIIDANAQKNFEASMTEVLPNANRFDEIEVDAFTPAEDGVSLESLYHAPSVGYVASATCSEGYGGDIRVMVGIAEDGKIQKTKIMAMSETPGLGAKANDADFLSQYIGLTAKISVIKNAEPSKNQIVAISGATRTSKAVTKAINAALEAVAFATEKGGAAE